MTSRIFALLIVASSLWLGGCHEARSPDDSVTTRDNGHPHGLAVTAAVGRLPYGGRPSARIPFPAISDWKTLKISLDRSPCLGFCAGYKVQIESDGTVRYHGDGYVAVSGNHQARVAIGAVRSLYNEFVKADFFWTFDEYRAGVTDNPTYVVSIAFDGRFKQVTDYVGRDVGMPKEISDLENAVDATAETSKWVRGDGSTFANLEAEHWNFPAADDEHQRLIESAASRGDGDLLRKLLAAGVSASTKFGCHGLEDAASSGNDDIVMALLNSGAPIHWDAPKENRYEYDCDCLSLAARSGAPRIVKAILSRHPNVNWQDRNGTTALMRAVPGGLADSRENDRDFPLVVKLLIDAGADVNLRDRDGKSAIGKVRRDAEVVHLLIAAGAKDVNQQDWRGETVLFSVYDASVAQALLEGGADPWLLNNDGRNAYEVASRMYGDLYGAGPVLKNWMNAHPKAR